jgi:phage shock protein A
VGLLDRIGKRLKQGTAAALAAAPDPRVVNISSYQKQRALLDQVAAAIQEVVAARKRLETSTEAVRGRLPALEQQARDQLKAGRRSAARLALERRHVAQQELQALEGQLDEVQGEEARLVEVQQRLSVQIDAFAARQEVIRARYSAAEAQVRIGEAMTGVSTDFEDLTQALQRAEEKTQTLQARATAIDRLVQEGDLVTLVPALPETGGAASSQPSGAESDIDRQLEALERELA